MLSGIVRMRRYPFAAATHARAIPVFPLVGSTIVVTPGWMTPSSSARSIIATPMRSLTENPGLNDEFADKYSGRISREPRQPHQGRVADQFRCVICDGGAVSPRCEIAIDVFDRANGSVCHCGSAPQRVRTGRCSDVIVEFLIKLFKHRLGYPRPQEWLRTRLSVVRFRLDNRVHCPTRPRRRRSALSSRWARSL